MFLSALPRSRPQSAGWTLLHPLHSPTLIFNVVVSSVEDLVPFLTHPVPRIHFLIKQIRIRVTQKYQIWPNPDPDPIKLWHSKLKTFKYPKLYFKYYYARYDEKNKITGTFCGQRIRIRMTQKDQIRTHPEPQDWSSVFKFVWKSPLGWIEWCWINDYSLWKPKPYFE